MAEHIHTGKLGEQIAKDHLKLQGHIILSTNYRYKRSEIDIISRSEDTLIFTEVKTRKNKKYGNPEDFIDELKVEKIEEAAENYILENHWEGKIRFDIISIILERGSVIETIHIEDALF